MTQFQFQFINLPVEAVPVVIPFAKWQEAANSEQFTSQPIKS